ncbi:T9SS type A sorting domain-containing protein [Parvicella tangerina]|uniref:Secretion system C-terminal sorting domain-containing protein n=1 Tax=Parvicella tangerina TaxID=2829795 RepID=A0A916NA03_9FLAO|nr:T9SS type A sorting domain-containing protein [Parvicella tangerina]CAG5078225.1 hypothetical protein CRYO30217_00612 [Parvicella tangerina]
MKLLLIFLFSFFVHHHFAQWEEIKSDIEREFYELKLCDNSDSLLVLGDIGDTSGYIKFNTSTLQERLVPTTSLPVAIHQFSDTASWLLTDIGELFYSIDDFSSSSKLISDLSIFSLLTDIHFVTDSVGFVCEDQNGTTRMFKTVNKGLNWIQVGATSNVGGNELVVFNDTLLSVDENGAFVTSDTGTTWYADYYQTINDRWFSDVFKSENDGRMIFVGQGYDQSQSMNFGAIAVSTDYGETWSFQDIFSMNRFLDIEMVNDSVGYITGQPQGTQIAVYKTIDGGISWHPQGYVSAPVGSLRYHRIECLSEDVCFVCGTWGKVLRTTNGGGAFMDVSVDESELDQISLYPNPVSSTVFIESLSEIKSINIYNIQGQLLKSAITSGKNVSLDFSNYAKGLYVLSITTDTGTIQKKVQKL